MECPSGSIRPYLSNADARTAARVRAHTRTRSNESYNWLTDLSSAKEKAICPISAQTADTKYVYKLLVYKDAWNIWYMMTIAIVACFQIWTYAYNTQTK